MNRWIRQLALTLLALTSASVAAGLDVPRLLVVPSKKGTNGPVPNGSLANYLAQQLDEDGRVSPIVWGSSDPVFRDASLSGKLGVTRDFPTLRESLSAARSLGADYLLMYSTERKGKGLYATGELYVGGRRIWNDSENISTTQNSSIGGDDSAASIAHTWAVKLQSGALKGLQARPKVATPAPSRGQTPTSPPAAQQTADGNTNSIVDAAEALAKAGKVDAAILAARDAVDARPTDPLRRLLLVHMLQRKGNLNAAADAAVTGSILLPASAELRMAAIRCSIAAGRKDEAKAQINEMLARNPKDPTALLLEAQSMLEAADTDHAMSVLDHLVDSDPSTIVTYWRAVCRAILGGSEGVSTDADTYAKKPFPLNDALDNYRLAMTVLDPACKQALSDTADMLSQISARADSKPGREALDRLERQCQARAAFLDDFSSPDANKSSHGHRRLAQKLLSISLIDARRYLQSPDDDAMTDARINLGEAMKQLKAAREAIGAEHASS